MLGWRILIVELMRPFVDRRRYASALTVLSLKMQTEASQAWNRSVLK